MKKLGYIRTSTGEQLIDRQVIQLQEICDQVFVEDGVSAIAKHRPIYDDVIRELQAGDVFVVSSLDRAFRSVQDALAQLDILQKRGVEFLSLSQNFDTTTPDGKFLFTLAAALAAWEREVLSKRTKEGMEAARRKGKAIGRPPKLNAEDLRVVRKNLARDASLSLKDEALRLNVHQRTLIRALNEVA